MKHLLILVLLISVACSQAESPEAPAAEAPAETAEETASAEADATPDPPQVVFYPPEVTETGWLAERAAAQKADAASWKTFAGFGFRDARAESGIDWTHAIVDDAGIDYKGVHYDHGTAVAVADVDGDGLLDLYFVNQLGNNALWRNEGDGTLRGHHLRGRRRRVRADLRGRVLRGHRQRRRSRSLRDDGARREPCCSRTTARASSRT